MRRTAAALVAGTVLLAGCTEWRRASGEDCLKDQDCLSGVCSQLHCASVPPFLDAEPSAVSPPPDAMLDSASQEGAAQESGVADGGSEASVDALVEANSADAPAEATTESGVPDALADRAMPEPAPDGPAEASLPDATVDARADAPAEGGSTPDGTTDSPADAPVDASADASSGG